MAQSHRRSLLAVVFFTAAVGVHFFILTEGSVQLDDCEEGSITFVEFRSNSPTLRCYNLYSPEGVFQWKLQMNNGTTVELGTCTEYDRCTTLFTGTVRLYWSNRFGTRLYFYNASKEFSGLLHCTVMTNGTESTASCRINVVRVKPRSNITDLPLGSSGYSGHFEIPVLLPSNVSWSLTKDTGAIVQLGTCDLPYSPCTSLTSSFHLRRYKSTTRVYISSVMREFAGSKLSCSFTYENQTDTADVILNVYSQPQVTDCNLATSPGNWSAGLSCDVNHAYSSIDIYQFQVREMNPSTPAYSYCWCSSWLSSNSGVQTLDIKEHGWLSFRHGLRSYVNTTDNQLYYRGRLWYSWRLSPSHGEFKRATIYVRTKSYSNSGIRPVPPFFHMPTTAPGRPSHNCTGLSYIPEDGSITCVCTAADLGTPAGRLLWLLGNVTVTAGAYGDRHLLLPAVVVTRHQDHKLATCRLDWIEPQDVTLSLNVAFGPDKVDLEISQHDNKGTLQIIIGCHVTGMTPQSPDMVQWTGPCQSQQGFTCTLDPQHREVQGHTVTCKVTNTANNGHSAEAAKVIETGPAPVATTAQGSSEQLKWAAIGAAGMLGTVVVVVLLVVVVVVAVRRRGGLPCCAPVYDSTKPADRQRSGNDASDTHLYEVINNNRNKARATTSARPNPDAVYENACFEDGDKHM